MESSGGMPPPPPAAFASSAPQAPVPPPVCHDCGTVQDVRQVVLQGEGTGAGAAMGGILGGVLGHQVGSGRGNDAATLLGAIGGAVAGHQIEKSQRKAVRYEITVRMDDGAHRTVTTQNPPAWRGGERVRLVNGVLTDLM
jgi:outer membrane lipoprotein SlyB